MDDVVVVGAGYSGLIAAYRLVKKGFTVTVLEARDRVGGRTLDETIHGGMRLELGGQYIATVQTRVNALIEELGLELYPAWSTGDNFLELEHKIARYQSTPAACLVQQLHQPQSVQTEIEAILNKLADMFPAISPCAPWESVNATEWDGVTFHSWLESESSSPLVMQFFRFMTNQGFSTEPEQISLLQMLWFIKTSHGLPPWAIGGAQSFRVNGGTQLVAERMASYLGDRLKLLSPVVDITQNADSVCITTVDKTYHASKVIISIPPQLTSGMSFNPLLPADLYRAFAAFQTGNTMKVQAVYKKPFWREQGWSGNGILFNGPQTFTYDNSGPDNSPGVLLGFITATRATSYNQLPEAERRALVLNAWASVFGDEILNPIRFIEMDWATEPFTRGAHGCHFPPGVWRELGHALGKNNMPRYGRVFWAASDIAKDWCGYLEGAIQAGEQVATECGLQ